MASPEVKEQSSPEATETAPDDSENEKVLEEWEKADEAVTKELVNLATSQRSSSERIQVLRQQVYQNCLEMSKLEPSLQQEPSSIPTFTCSQSDELVQSLKKVDRSSKDLAAAEAVLAEILDIQSVVKKMKTGKGRGK